MKNISKTIITSLAALTLIAPLANTTTVHADSYDDMVNSIYVHPGEDALQAQYSRFRDAESSGKYNSAQVLTLETIQGNYAHKAFYGASDNDKAQYAKEMSDYLDKGVVGYSTHYWSSTYPTNMNDHSDFIITDQTGVYTFKGVNEPEIKHLEFPGYTIIDKNGNPSDGNIKMWLDNDYILHVDSNYTDPSMSNMVMVVKNGEKAPFHNSNPWTQQTNTVHTKHMSLLYTLQGTQVKNRALAGDTAWYSDRYATINGQTMYRVATNEWVSSNDLK